MLVRCYSRILLALGLHGRIDDNADQFRQNLKALTFRITDAIDPIAEIVRILQVKGNAFHINSSFILPKVLNPQEEMGLLELLQPLPHLRGKFA